MYLLGVNIDHVATLRQARGGNEPDVCEAARVAVKAGADSITVHLREDRRHIQDADVIALRKACRTKLNLEMALVPEIIDFAFGLVPDQVTLVPEKRRELTTEGGLNVVGEKNKIARTLACFRKKGIYFSLFVDPEPCQIKQAAALSVDAVELHTGLYAEARTVAQRKAQFKKLHMAALLAADLGLQVNAGHGLTYTNVGALCSIPCVYEFNIGHSIISRSLFVGLDTAVADMKRCITQATRRPHKRTQ